MKHGPWKRVRHAASGVVFFLSANSLLASISRGSEMGSWYKGKHSTGSNKDFLSISQTSTVTEVRNNLCSQQDIK
jgi:hypothetical protein